MGSETHFESESLGPVDAGSDLLTPCCWRALSIEFSGYFSIPRTTCSMVASLFNSPPSVTPRGEVIYWLSLAAAVVIMKAVYTHFRSRIWQLHRTRLAMMVLARETLRAPDSRFVGSLDIFVWGKTLRRRYEQVTVHQSFGFDLQDSKAINS